MLPHFQASHTKLEIPHHPTSPVLYPAGYHTSKWWRRHHRSRMFVPPSLCQTFEMCFSDPQFTQLYPHVFLSGFLLLGVLSSDAPCSTFLVLPILTPPNVHQPIATPRSGSCKAKINGSAGMTWVYRTPWWFTPSPSLLCTLSCCTWRAARDGFDHTSSCCHLCSNHPIRQLNGFFS